MANITITRGTTLPDSSAKSDFHGLVDNASVAISGIENADISNSAGIVDSKLATISTSQKVNTSALVTTSQAQGDILYASSSTAWTRLGASTASFVLTTKGAAANPVFGPAYSASVALTDQATIATDASLGNYFRVTLGGNRTLGNPTNALNGQKLLFEIIQDGTGGRTLALDTKFALGSDIATTTLTTTASARDFIGCVYNSTADKFYIIAFVKGY